MLPRQLYIGLMSGTSADGIDAALVDMQTTPRLVNSHTEYFSSHLRKLIHDISLPGPNEIDRMGSLDVELGKCFAACVQALLDKAGIKASDVVAIGSHGQTIRHRPPGSEQGTFTLQIGDPNIIAELTGITTVADFRRRDMAAGGQGAPLVPAFHRAMLHSSTSDRVVVNIGGMANITWLPAKGAVIGFDTGPGNVLMDLWSLEHLNQPYDRDGSWAASGNVERDLLLQFLKESFFSKPFPKSTGREHFNRVWLEKYLANFSDRFTPANIQATLLQLTVVTVSDAIKALGGTAKEVFVCGGGGFNRQLLSNLQKSLPDCKVDTTATCGIDPQWIEAMAFAWLAKQTMDHRPGNLRAVTGANREVILGGVYYA